jgi:hypothetical protein
MIGFFYLMCIECICSDKWFSKYIGVRSSGISLEYSGEIIIFVVTTQVLKLNDYRPARVDPAKRREKHEHYSHSTHPSFRQGGIRTSGIAVLDT